MEFTSKSINPVKQTTNCLVIAVNQPRQLSATGKIIDKASNGELSKLVRRGDMEGRTGQVLFVQNPSGVKAERILLVGCGKREDRNETAFSSVVNAMYSALSDSGAKDAHFNLNDVDIVQRDNDWKVRQAVILINSQRYRFDQMKSKKNDRKVKFNKLTINLEKAAESKNAAAAIEQGVAIGAGMDLTRDLGNLPANVCTPGYLAKQAKAMARGESKLKVKILDEAEMRKLKMGSLLSVSAGSRQAAKLIVFEYNGATRKTQPIVLVGKGVTFDTGGISLKPGAAMDEMKFDMCGAASVFGTLRAVVSMKLPVNVVGIVPATENMPDGLATKPGDIVTSMSGQTIEILNTDAEGRLILCDALTYAEKYKPHCVVDIATLTGACIIALGKVPSAVLGNNDPLINQLIESGQQINDKLWQLPLWDEYQDQLKSNFADMANIGSRDAGTITAACFLSRFTKKYHWAHLDIAGTAWKSGEQKGATGRPVPLLTQFILNQVK